jgi:hypothetical protein
MPRLHTGRSGFSGGFAAGEPGFGGRIEVLRLRRPDRLLPHGFLSHRLLCHRLLCRGPKAAFTAGLEPCSLLLGVGILTHLLTVLLSANLHRGTRGRLLRIRAVTRFVGGVAFRAPTEQAGPTRIRLRWEFAVGLVLLIRAALIANRRGHPWRPSDWQCRFRPGREVEGRVERGFPLTGGMGRAARLLAATDSSGMRSLSGSHISRDARPGGLFDPRDTHGLVVGIGCPGPPGRATRLDRAHGLDITDLGWTAGPGGFSDLLDILSLRALLELLGLTGEANGITDVAYWMPYPTHLGHRRIRRATGAFLRDWVHRRPFRPSRSAGRRADLGVRIQIEHPGLDQLRAWELLPTRRRASADRRVLLPGRCLRADGLRSFGGIEGLLGSGHSTGGRRGTGRRSDLSRLLTAGRRSTNRPARPR